jgi:hypothetical protein
MTSIWRQDDDFEGVLKVFSELETVAMSWAGTPLLSFLRRCRWWRLEFQHCHQQGVRRREGERILIAEQRALWSLRGGLGAAWELLEQKLTGEQSWLQWRHRQ